MNQDNEEENVIPSTEDIKDYIREELEKHIATQQLTIPHSVIASDSLSRMFEDENSESLIQANDAESNSGMMEGIFLICDLRG